MAHWFWSVARQHIMLGVYGRSSSLMVARKQKGEEVVGSEVQNSSRGHAPYNLTSLH